MTNSATHDEGEKKAGAPLPIVAISEFVAQLGQSDTPDDLATALEELQTLHEELRVAEEELIAQNEDLMEARVVLEEERGRYQELFDFAPDGYVVTDCNGIIADANRAASELFALDARFLVGKPLASFIVAEDRAAFRALLLEAAGRRHSWTGVVQPRAGENFPANFTLAIGDNTVYRWLVRDISERRAAESALYEANQTLNALIQAAPVSIHICDLDGTISLWNPASERTFGWLASEVVGREMPNLPPEREREMEIAMRDWREGIAYQSVETQRLRRDATLMDVALWTAPICDAAGDVLSTIGVAVDISERKQSETVRKQLMERIVEVQEDERRRLSRELHDTLGQHLTALLLGLKALDMGADAPCVERRAIAPKTTGLKNMVDEMMRTAHRLAWELRPAELDDMGLEVALRRYIEHWSQASGVAADFQSTGCSDERLAPCNETAFFRVAQEALTNITRHADARCVSVVLKCDEAQAALIIEDDGRGFDASALHNRLGITGMRERLALVGGTLQIESSVGQGTAIYARIPYPEVPRAGAPVEEI